MRKPHQRLKIHHIFSKCVFQQVHPLILNLRWLFRGKNTQLKVRISVKKLTTPSSNSKPVLALRNRQIAQFRPIQRQTITAVTTRAVIWELFYNLSGDSFRVSSLVEDALVSPSLTGRQTLWMLTKFQIPLILPFFWRWKRLGVQSRRSITVLRCLGTPKNT